MSYRDKIEKQLEGLPREHCIAFAARAALRTLPLLAGNEKKEEVFLYWEGERKERYLLAVLLASCFSLARSVALNKTHAVGYARNCAAVARGAADAARAYSYSYAAARAAADAAYAAARAPDAAPAPAPIIRDAANAAARAIRSAARDTNASRETKMDNYFKTEITADLLIIQNTSDIHAFLQSPLWRSGFPNNFKDIFGRFKQGIKALDSGFEVWLDWYQQILDGKPIDLELLEKQTNIPEEINSQGVKAVNAYLKTLVEAKKSNTELQPLNRVRAIFIGNGAAGKTSLIKALNGEEVVEGKEKMTPGIDIREWPVANTGITAHFWDFGGQVMAHSTHQFFLRERCLYILVMDARTEINANEQAEYWLEHIRTFGKSAPVMLVGNKSDLAQVNLDMHSLTEKYPNIIDFYPLSCSQYQNLSQPRFDTFQQDLITELQKVGTHQVYFTDQQFDVMQNLQKLARKQAFLTQQDFKTLCDEQQISSTGEQNQEWLLDLLDKLGIVVHFPQLARLDSFILNPRWLTYGIYTLLYSDQAKDSAGVLSEMDVITILSNKEIDDGQGSILDYSPDKCGFILDAMEEFKLCYRLPADRKKVVIPDLLPSDQPQHGFDKRLEGTLIFEFDFRGFLPRHLMPTFIVNRYDEIKNNTCWQQGVLLHSEQYDCDALVQVDYHQRSLSLCLQGGQLNRYFTVLRDEVVSILQRLPDLYYQEWLWLSEDMDEQSDSHKMASPGLSRRLAQHPKADFKQLLALEAAGQAQYICADGIYNLSKILQVMPAPLRQNIATKVDKGKALNKSAQNISLFISYAHKDEDFKDDLVVSLKGMQRDYAELEWWDDRQLVSGQWEEQILAELEKADIVVLLISRDFMASDYCFKIEMEKALLKYEQKGHLVVPILIRETANWSRQAIGQMQALPKDAKPLDKWLNPDQFWADVQKGLERILEQLLLNRSGE